ncbi:MAG TPA: hypothetical protein VGF73_11335 [Chthoniobacterales bacterium]
MPELLITPAPLMESVVPGETARVMIVNGLAPGSKVMLATSMLVGTVIVVTLETSKVAASVGLLGTVAGIQFPVVVHRPSIGAAFQLALPAWAA